MFCKLLLSFSGGPGEAVAEPTKNVPIGVGGCFGGTLLGGEHRRAGSDVDLYVVEWEEAFTTG